MYFRKIKKCWKEVNSTRKIIGQIGMKVIKLNGEEVLEKGNVKRR